MSLRTTLRGLSTATALIVLSVACTPDAEAPPPPTASTTATTSAPTPPETSLERQTRLDFAAAEKSYRTFRAEYRRVLRKGGAKKPTKVMKETAGGPYLAEIMTVVEAYEGLGDHQVGYERIVYVRPNGYSATELTLNVCEDGRPIKAFDKNGKDIGPGEIRTAHLKLLKKRDRWKVWSGDGEKVRSCG